MATIHMDVDSVRNAKRNLQRIHSTLSDALSEMDRAVNPVIGHDWLSGSANEFNSLYSDIRGQMIREMSNLEKMASELDRQIRVWEEISARLG